MSITKTNPAKNFKRAKRIAQKQNALTAKSKSSRVEKAISLAGREKKTVDIANYGYNKHNQSQRAPTNGLSGVGEN